MRSWLLLHYTLPPNPSASRVYAWRKLKKLGAVLLNESIWVLPDTPRTAEHFQWLASEILEMKGDVYVWRSNLFLQAREDALVNQFIQQVDASYKVLLKKLNKKNPDPLELSREYQQASSGDYFNSQLGIQVREKLLSLKKGDAL